MMKNWEYYRTDFSSIVELAVQTIRVNGEWIYAVNGKTFQTRQAALQYAMEWLVQDKQVQSTSSKLGILGEC